MADEFVAFSLACLALPEARSALWIVAAFTLFRIIDIAKVPPMGYAESFDGDLSIALDDVIAALLARRSGARQPGAQAPASLVARLRP